MVDFGQPFCRAVRVSTKRISGKKERFLDREMRSTFLKCALMANVYLTALENGL